MSRSEKCTATCPSSPSRLCSGHKRIAGVYFFEIFEIIIREARWLVKVDDDTVLSTNRLKMLVDKLEMEEEEGAEVEEEIFCKHKKDPVLRPEDPKPYWVSN